MNPEKIPENTSSEEKVSETFDPITAAQEQERNSRYQPWKNSAEKPEKAEEEGEQGE